MIIELMPYPAMRDSGVEWLGKVPEHWEVRRLKMLSRREQNGSTPSMEHPEFYTDEGLPWYGPPSLGEALSVGRPSRYVSELALEQSKVRAIIPPALAVSVIGNVGRCALLLQPGATNQQITCFELVEKLCVPRFVARQFRLAEKSLIASASSATISILDSTVVRGTPLVLPPLPEQNAIVRYLDYVDRRVRRLTRAKRKLVVLLAEQKQAIIHLAVTRGLDPNVPMKDSGIEWLGKVPEHWDVRRLRNVADMRVSNVDKHIKDDEKTVRLCNYVDVYKNDHINKNIDFMRATATPEEIDKFRLEENDVLITKDSETWNDIGVPALVTELTDNLISGYHLALLRPFSNKLKGEFLFRALQSKGLAYQFHIEAKGVTRYGLSHAGIKSVWVPLPPLPEQTAIVEYLDQTTAEIDTAIARANREIELLDEYRTRLIADVVTGKLDVRKAAASLPKTDPLEMEEESP